jgi:two-component system response regulator RpaA
VLLVIEDEAMILDMLHMVLDMEGYIVLEATDGQAGWAQALDAQPDLILTDIMLPVLDGHALCRQLRADPRTAHIPVIAMSAAYRPQDGDAFDAVLAKPFQIAPLLAVIVAHLGGAP